MFRGEVIGRYIADMVVESTVVVEVKAAESIGRSHRAQLVNYLRASDLPVGLVLNFGQSARLSEWSIRVADCHGPRSERATTARRSREHRRKRDLSLATLGSPGTVWIGNAVASSGS